MAVTTKNFSQYKVIKCKNIGSTSSFQLPAGYYIDSIVIDNNSSISVDIEMGYAVPTNNILASTPVSNNSSQIINGFSIAKNHISTTNSYTITISATTAWGGAVIDLYIKLAQYN